MSITLETAFRIEAVGEAMAKYGKPGIFNTDQGSQFTSINLIKMLKDADIKIPMDGKGAWRDNVFIERLWRTVNMRGSISGLMKTYRRQDAKLANT